MKNKIKKSLVVLGVAITLVSNSMPAFAASCLSVRDYGYHKFDHRTSTQTSQVVMGMSDRGLRIKVYVTTRKWCVCGMEVVDRYDYDTYFTNY